MDLDAGHGTEGTGRQMRAGLRIRRPNLPGMSPSPILNAYSTILLLIFFSKVCKILDKYKMYREKYSGVMCILHMLPYNFTNETFKKYIKKNTI